MPLDSATESRMKREHFEKYESLAQRIGIAKLIPLVPASKEGILLALTNGDQYLNSIPLARWDRAIGYGSKPPEKCSYCGQMKPWKAPNQSWRPAGVFRIGSPLSIAECVCILKHVALYHIAEVKHETL